VDGATHAYRKAIELNSNGDLMRDLAKLLDARGKLEAVRTAWAKVLEGNPPDHASWYGYAQLCLFLGNEGAFRRARTAMLDRFGGTATEWYEAERISLACWLRPAAGEELRRVVEMVDRAAAVGPKPPNFDHAYIQFVQGLAQYRQGRPAQAIPLLEASTTRLTNRAGPRLAPPWPSSGRDPRRRHAGPWSRSSGLMTGTRCKRTSLQYVSATSSVARPSN
jgi:serine/threonine-protein kinase